MMTQTVSLQKNKLLIFIIALLFIGWLIFSQACVGNVALQAVPTAQEKGNFGEKNAPVANHASVAEFDRIPDTALQVASSFRILFNHASTGGRISQLGLDYLQGTTGNPSPYLIDKYDRRNWVWQEWRYDGLSRERNLVEKVIDKINGNNAMSRIKMSEFITDVAQDHQKYDVICPEYYSDELGHPNIEGSVRLAKGFWWLVTSLGR